jgi:hypothetical protein
MKRAAILVLAIATLVMIVSPSAYPPASSAFARKSITIGPSAQSPAPASGYDTKGPTTTTGGGGGGGGGGTDEGDADGLSGMKIKPGTQTTFSYTTERLAISLMMWWRSMLFIR